VTPYRLSICGLDELARFRRRRVSHLVSILDPGHPMPSGWESRPFEARLDLRFHDVIEETEGMIAPTVSDVERLLGFGSEILGRFAEAAHLLIHCHAGVSRSTAAATLLVAAACPERDAEEVIVVVSRLRPVAWPNLRMVEMGDALLGRKGGLVAALRTQYRAVLEREPEWAEVMRDEGRQRELEHLRSEGAAV